jgi:hypothetical protein
MSPATAPQTSQQAPQKPAGTTPAPAVAGTKSAAQPPAAAATAPAQGVKVDATTQAAVEQKGGKLAGLKGMSAGALGKMKGVGKLPKRTLMILAVVVVAIVIVGIAAVALSGGEKKPSGGGGINIAKLEDWSAEMPAIAQNLAEGSATQPNSVTFDIGDLLGENATGLYFITDIEASLSWTDEPNQRWAGRTRINQPDNFQLEINSTVNASAKSEVKANDVSSKQGSIALSLTISGDYSYVVVGNLTDMNLPEEASKGDITVVVYLYEAEDLYASGPAAFKLNDLGNDFTLTIKVKGKAYNP